jgi:hypothetical protein
LKTTNWKDVAETVGIAAILVSLIIIVIELRQTQSALIASTYQTRALDAVRVEGVKADSEVLGPLLARVDLDDPESLATLNELERFRLRSYFVSRLIDLDNEYYQYQKGFLDDEYFEYWFKDQLKRSARAWRSIGLTERRPSFKQFVDELLAEPTG